MEKYHKIQSLFKRDHISKVKHIEIIEDKGDQE